MGLAEQTGFFDRRAGGRSILTFEYVVPIRRISLKIWEPSDEFSNFRRQRERAERVSLRISANWLDLLAETGAESIYASRPEFPDRSRELPRFYDSTTDIDRQTECSLLRAERSANSG